MTYAGSKVSMRSQAGLSPPPWFSGKPGTVLGEPRNASFFCQCPAGISQALSLGSCAFRTACGPPFSRGPSPSDPSPPPPPPGTPHPASSPAWAGSRPEGLHQRACSVSSADPWTEAAALPPGTQDPVRPGGKRASTPTAPEQPSRAQRRWGVKCAWETGSWRGHTRGPHQWPVLETLPASAAPLPTLCWPQAALVALASPSAPRAASSSASLRGDGEGSRG